MLRNESRQTGNDLADSECAGHRNPQCASQALQTSRCIFGLIEIPQDATCSFEKRAAGIRWRHLPRGAQKKLDSEPRLKVRHHSGYGRLRDPEFASHAREAAGLCRTNERGQFLKPVTHTRSV